MVNYNNGKIYKIEPIGNYEDGDIYIGSTTKKLLCQRMALHRATYKRYKKNLPGSKIRSYYLFDKYGVENCTITLLELVHTSSKDELQIRERYYIQSLKCVNACIPMNLKDLGKSGYCQKYHKDHRESISTRQKLYHIVNRDKISERKKINYLRNKQCTSMKTELHVLLKSMTFT